MVISHCRMCGSDNLVEFLNLGHHPPSNGFLTSGNLREPETYYPLNVLACVNCGLAQLGYIVPKRVLFGPDYPYDSSTSSTFRKHFDGMAGELTSRFEIQSDSLAIDIGSNTGSLLEGFKDRGLRVLGIEPADNMSAKANDKGLETLNAFLSREIAKSVVESHGQSLIVTATNVFAHIDDLVEIVDSVRILLGPSGVFVVEVQYFLDMVQHMEYDQVYHEHYSYMTLSPMVRFFEKHGLEIFDSQHVATHGGSIRIFVGHPGEHAKTDAVREFMEREKAEGVLTSERLSSFAQQVVKSRNELLDCLMTIKGQGKRIVGIGAPAKGNTLLNYGKISTPIVDYLTDNAVSKIGLYSPGMHIPVVSEGSIADQPPDYGMILAWNLKAEIMPKFEKFARQGGKFIIPVPNLSII